MTVVLLLLCVSVNAKLLILTVRITAHESGAEDTMIIANFNTRVNLVIFIDTPSLGQFRASNIFALNFIYETTSCMIGEVIVSIREDFLTDKYSVGLKYRIFSKLLNPAVQVETQPRQSLVCISVFLKSFLLLCASASPW